MRTSPRPSPAPEGAPRLSIVVPFFNEEGNATPLLEEIREQFPAAEILAVDDGSTDETTAILSRRADIRVLRHASNRGQSAALRTGFVAVTGDLIALMDGDGQNDPRDLHTLIAAWRPGAAVCGRRVHRKDPWPRVVSGKIANRVRRWFLDDDASDSGCGLKVFHRDALKFLPPFRSLHRFLPAFFKAGGLEIIEVPVAHRPRRSGKSKYGITGRAVRGIADLWTVQRLVREIRAGSHFGADL